MSKKQLLYLVGGVGKKRTAAASVTPKKTLMTRCADAQIVF
jgi:hypothetical protein